MPLWFIFYTFEVFVCNTNLVFLISLCCWHLAVVGSIPTGGNFIFSWNFLKPFDVNFVPKFQICATNGIHEIVHDSDVKKPARWSWVFAEAELVLSGTLFISRTSQDISSHVDLSNNRKRSDETEGNTQEHSSPFTSHVPYMKGTGYYPNKSI